MATARRRPGVPAMAARTEAATASSRPRTPPGAAWEPGTGEPAGDGAGAPTGRTVRAGTDGGGGAVAVAVGGGVVVTMGLWGLGHVRPGAGLHLLGHRRTHQHPRGLPRRAVPRRSR